MLEGEIGEKKRSERLLRMVDVADRLAISRAMAYRLVANGELPAVVVGPRCLRVPEAAILALINGARAAEPGGRP